MIAIDNWLLFSSIALVATLTPGPAILLAMTHSLSYGVRATVVTIFGNISGLLILSCLSVLGLSALLLYSASIFMLLKLVGALYLIYLGVRLFINGFPQVDPDRQQQIVPGFHHRYLQGLLVALSNPKAIAFTMALFPQFIDPAQPAAPQFAILVLTFMGFSFACLLGYAMMAENTGRQVSKWGISRIVSRGFGSVFVLAGLLLLNTPEQA